MIPISFGTPSFNIDPLILKEPYDLYPIDSNESQDEFKEFFTLEEARHGKKRPLSNDDDDSNSFGADEEEYYSDDDDDKRDEHHTPVVPRVYEGLNPP